MIDYIALEGDIDDDGKYLHLGALINIKKNGETKNFRKGQISYRIISAVDLRKQKTNKKI